MKNTENLIKLFLVSTLLIAPMARAQSQSPPAVAPKSTEVLPSAEDLLKNLDYPELGVVPRASERLAMEAESEKSAPYLVNWTITAPALVTLYVSQILSGSYRSDPPLTSTEKVEADQAVSFARLVGATGALVGIGLPYFWGARDASEKIKNLKDKDKKGQLLRERAAEEALEKQASVMNLIRYGFAITNLYANGAMSSKAKTEDKQYVALAVLAGLVPFFLPPRQVETYRKQQDYKKKIYTPVAGLGLGWSESRRSLVPEYQLVWNF